MNNEIFNKQIIKQELMECFHDPVYFISKYAKFEHPCYGTSDFNPYGYQEKLLYSYKDNEFNITHGARQVGLTIITAMYVFWYAMFHSDKKIVIASKNLKAGRDILEKIRHAYEHLPKYIQPEICTNLKGSIRFNNGSSIDIITSDAVRARGCSLNLLVLDSYAYWTHHKQDDFYKTMFPCFVKNNSSLIITSTAAPDGGMFETIFKRALRGDNKFMAHHIKWDMVQREEGFQERVTQIIGEAGWKVEYECSKMIKEDHNGTLEEYKSQDT